MRTLIATLVVPIVVVCGLLLPAAFDSRNEFEDPASAVFAVAFQYFFVLAFTVAVVVPLRFLWRRWDFMRAWVAILIGSVLGCGVMVTFAVVYAHIPLLASQPIAPSGLARGISILAVTGAIAGLVFWRIAKAEMRPDTSLERTRER